MANERSPENERPMHDSDPAGPEAESPGESSSGESGAANEFGGLEGMLEPEDPREEGPGQHEGSTEGAVSVTDALAERDRIRDQHLRLAADFDNYRKRTDADLRARWDRAQAELIGKLLEPMDDLQRVAAWEPETTSVDAIVEGVDLVERKFRRALEDVGVEMIDPEGAAFDPNTMEAMMRVPTDNPDHDDMVERVFQKGASLKGHLVRPARVSVYKSE